MSLPGNGIFVVQGEMAMLVTAMRRSTRWGSHSFPNEEYDMLMKTFQDLKIILNQVDDLRLLDPATYLSPFLEVIRSKETTGPVTSLALSSIHKFLSYGLIDPTHPSVPATVEDIADAVTHARFVGTDHSSDGVVLMKILQVLRTLMLSPEGAMLTDDSVCEIMLSCFRICFETRLTELLRRNAEQCLRDMTQLIFMRLPQFPIEDNPHSFTTLGLSLKRRDKVNKRKSLTNAHSTNSLDRKSPVAEPAVTESLTDTEVNKTLSIIGQNQDKNLINEAEITIEPVDGIKSPKRHGRHSSMDLANGNTPISQLLEKCVSGSQEEKEKENEEEEKGKECEQIETVEVGEAVSEEVPEEAPSATEENKEAPKEEIQSEEKEKVEEYVNHRGIRFTAQDDSLNLQPYGLTCIREIFRFLISLCNPLDTQNTSAMVHLGLQLVQVVLEVAADHLASYTSLMYLIKDPLCRNLLSLLDTERISIFALDLQIWFLLFEALRVHLKFQMEAFFKKIIEILSIDTSKAIYELKEIHHIALENLAQMFRIPGLCTELYLNFDCDVYCTNVFEELTKLLSKNVVSSTAYNIHSLSLEVLMTIIEAIEIGTSQKEKEEVADEREVERIGVEYGRGGHVSLELGGMDDASVVSDHVTHDISQYFVGGRSARHKPSVELPSDAELDNIKNMKKWVTQGTELFNQKPERGIEFLQEHGVLATPLDPDEVANFLRENPDLDKKMIGEYICKRSSRGEDEGPSVLSAFANSFDYSRLRIEQALRLYLETFRLPGEAPLIFLVMEKFAERWHTTNGCPFANTDAAFRLAYAVIMLNMDQHNHNAKKLNVPMTVDDFVRNLRGCNGSGDFPTDMLKEIFYSIKNEEMVMPAELHALHARLLPAACPPAVTALSAAFERSTPPTAEEIETSARDCLALSALSGLERCAALVARLRPAPDTLTLDTLLLTLSKFTGLLAPHHASYIAVGVSLGQASKAQQALRRACAVWARHAECVRAGWRHLLEITCTLYVGRLLPKCLVEAEDYLSPTGTVSLIREASRGTDSGLLSSIYSYIALGETGIRAPTPHEKALIDAATECVASCNLPGLLVSETKFLPVESLQELIQAMIAVGAPPDPDSLQLNPQLEDITIFFFELLGQTLIQNRDRLLTVWEECGPHLERVVVWAAGRGHYALARALTALLRTAARLMRCELCAPTVLLHLQLLFRLPYKLFYQQADVISCGIYEIVKTSAQNIHSGAEWGALLALLAAAGAGAWPRDAAPPASASRSEGSEEENDRRPTSVSSESELSHSPQTQGWILVKNESGKTTEAVEVELEQVQLRAHRSSALGRCVEALALVIRDVAHVTPHNCRAAVRAVRLLARATLHSGKTSKLHDNRKSKGRGRSDSSDEEDSLDSYHMVSIQLLDLMHTLHSRTAQIFKWWRDEADQEQNAEEYDLWEVAWKPLLQGIAEFCTDRRKQVANSAIAYLQRALLAPALAALRGAGWEACFSCVLLPLLARPPRRHETAARANTLMCKVFLQHLQALSARASFAALWARVVRVQRALLAASAEPLREGAQESLKNMLLVMHSVKIFSNGDGYNDLWYLTWDIIGEFLPNLKQELFPDVNDNTKPTQNLPSHMQPSIPHSLPTLIPVAPNSMPNVPSYNTSPTNTNLGQQPPNVAQPYPFSANTTNTLQSSPIHAQRQTPNILVGSMASSPVNLPMTPPGGPTLVAPVPLPGTIQQILPQHTNVQGGLQNMYTLQQNVLTQQQSAPTQQQNAPNAQESVPTAQQSVQTSQQFVQQNIPTLQQNLSPVQQIVPTVQQNVPPVPQSVPVPQSGVARVVSPTLGPPVSGMVAIRNPLYDQSGLTSSVLLQPLNEMVSTPIGISIQPTNTTNDQQPDQQQATESVQQSEIFAEYLTNPYNDVPKAEDKKSFSANVTPMHSGSKAQFGSTDNVNGSGMFNFSSYFTSGMGSGVFDTLMSTQEG
ncbi:Golgi-specific brefeldin A-resistance guanine nucleotide exchange factor 1 [Zerene cesonia]|uniref:Golgi-specific brefeldin A-resistance guanine nucleotide exchange factor 1 n=1 Tax=Zerene cesonia TaxID=33412 RepID=UPI0018E546AC|nr:Golgi-specific brefeldin A-resistance guanine nucleotide exchange factor 1 [Zerene cesonia]